MVIPVPKWAIPGDSDLSTGIQTQEQLVNKLTTKPCSEEKVAGNAIC
jgi:hypothetical protein